MTATVRGVKPDGRGSSINRELQTDYTVTYLVTTDDAHDGPSEVRQAQGIPAIGDIYSVGNDFDVRAVATEKRVSARESPTEWEVEVSYSTVIGKKPDQENDQNPITQDVEVSFTAQQRTRVLAGYYANPALPQSLRDLDAPVVSSNGEPFDPQPEVDVSDPVMTMRKNFQSINIPYLLSLGNTVNASEFYGADARALRLSPPQMTLAFDPSVGEYWQVTFEFIYREETWDLQLLNTGTYYIDANGKKFPFKDEEGRPFVGLLDADGGALNWGVAGTEGQWGRYISGGDAPTFSRLRVYREVDFNSLGII